MSSIPIKTSKKDKKLFSNIMKPARNIIHDKSFCKLKLRNKNLWITGKRNQLEKFIHEAIGDDPSYVYNKDSSNLWINYKKQPFIIFRIFDRLNVFDTIKNIRLAGSNHIKTVQDGRSFIKLNPNDYHCIILSCYTPKEYCNGPSFIPIEYCDVINKYDILTL